METVLWPEMLAEITKELEKKTVPKVVAELNRIVADWEGKPEFGAKMHVTKWGIERYFTVTGPHANKFNWLNHGTRGPYKIQAKPGSALSFPGMEAQEIREPGIIFGGTLITGRVAVGIMRQRALSGRPRVEQGVLSSRVWENGLEETLLDRKSSIQGSSRESIPNLYISG